MQHRTFLCDSNVFVAALSPWHDHHDDARRAIAQRSARGDALIVSAHSLIETYSVLTRLPPLRRAPAQLAEAAIRGIVGDAQLVGLTTNQVSDLLADLAKTDTLGGAAYDALIIETAIRAGVDEILTFNVRDFERLARGRIAITRPGAQ